MRVAIIGAGIIGASCAYHLSKLGQEVMVIEKNPSPAMGSTAKSAAGIRLQFSHPVNIKMSQYGLKEYKSFQSFAHRSAGFRNVGYHFLIDEKLKSEWLKQMDLQQNLGVNIDFLTDFETKQRYGYINVGGLIGSSLDKDAGTLDPDAITQGYIKTAKQNHAKILLDTEVTDLQFKNSSWQIKTNNGDLTADAILNAAGPHAAQVAALAGFEIPVLPYRRNVFITGPIKAFPHPSPLTIDMTTGVYFRSEGGRIIFGLSNHNEKTGFNEQVDWDWLEHTLTLALPRFPFLENAGLDYKSSWAGLYAITPDHFPILGRMPNSSFYNAVGFSGHGVQHAAAAGKILAEEIINGKVSSFDISDYRFERFEQRRPTTETNII